MTTALRAGLAYFAAVFAAGFALGTLRVLLLVPRLGEMAAILVELPLMLALSWLASRWLTGRFAVAPQPRPRLAMGAFAFALLLAAELGVSVIAFGRSPAEHLATYREPRALLGLAAQVAFALFPLLQAGRRKG